MSENDEQGWFAHPSAEVEEGAHVGAGASIWRFSHVRAGARIGERVMIGQGCYVAPTAVVGAGSRVQNQVSIYDGVELGEDVFVGPSAVFTNVRTPRAHVARRDAFEKTVIGRGASIGANATVVCGVRVGEYAMIGAGAVVTREVDPYRLVVGAPARPVAWVCQCGARLREPAPRSVCSVCDREYMFVDDELFAIE